MKTTILILAAATMLSPDNSMAQRGGGGGTGGFGARGRGEAPEPLPSEALQLPRFDLDFPGGNPGQLVQAIEKASGKPLNAIIPDEYAKTPLPPLKLRAVNVPELFQALTAASEKRTNYVTGTYFGGGGGQASSQYQSFTMAYGFRTIGVPREDSIWHFFYESPALPPELAQAAGKRAPVCRFFQLGPYLETYKIEDITTAIETGWRMLGAPREFTPPQISFHKDTKLLIAVGDPEKLKLIDSVLEQLPPAGSSLKPGPGVLKNPPPPQKSGEPDRP